MKNQYLKSAAFSLFTFAATVGSLLAQPSERELAKHQKEVAKSAEKKQTIVSLDTLFHAGKPYGTLTKGGSVLDRSFSFADLSGEEQISIIIDANDTNFFLFQFNDPARLVARMEIVGGQEWIGRILIKYRLLREDGTLDEASVGSFTRINPAQVLPINVVVNNPNEEKALPQRNRSALVFVNGGTIRQDNTVVGSAETKNELVDKKYERVLYIYHVDGSVCARAYLSSVANGHIIITTSKDNRTQTINESFMNDDKVAKWLIERLYL